MRAIEDAHLEADLAAAPAARREFPGGCGSEQVLDVVSRPEHHFRPGAGGRVRGLGPRGYVPPPALPASVRAASASVDDAPGDTLTTASVSPLSSAARADPTLGSIVANRYARTRAPSWLSDVGNSAIAV